MPQPNDLSRSLAALDQDSTLIAVVESVSLHHGWVPWDLPNTRCVARSPALNGELPSDPANPPVPSDRRARGQENEA
jgi:hypothetical protein